MARSAPNVTELQRDILETAISSQSIVNATQQELYSQGKKLRQSLKDASFIAGQTVVTGNKVDTLVKEARAGRLRSLLTFCTSSLCCKRAIESGETGNLVPTSPNFSPVDEEDHESEDNILARLERLRKLAEKDESAATWRKTLVPSGNAVQGGSDIWYRQIELSLNQLKNLSEAMGYSLDEQINQAQMLTAYLNYGVDQVINTNKNLLAAKSLF